MRSILFSLILSLFFGYQNVHAQCDFITPPTVKKIDFAAREITFSSVTMNGKVTTYLAVRKGETVKIKTVLSGKKKGDYCPGCIVQIYWGIRGYISTCAKNFHGYQFSSKKSSLKFQAPLKDGIYYITMGSSLQYSCKNDINKPNCSPDYAFAVLKVGNPAPERKKILKKVKKASRIFLTATLSKSCCFGGLDKTEWFFNGKKLAHDGENEIPLRGFGVYKVLKSNCITSIADSLNHISNNIEAISPSLTEKKEPKLVDSTDVAVLIASKDKFVLEHLIFDLNKSYIKPEAENELDKLAQIMKSNPSMKILLEGHTAQGSARKNKVLSEERVKSTKKYLVKKGVEKSNIQTKGWGQQKPLIHTKNIEKGKINRRVEISILSR